MKRRERERIEGEKERREGKGEGSYGSGGVAVQSGDTLFREKRERKREREREKERDNFNNRRFVEGKETACGIRSHRAASETAGGGHWSVQFPGCREGWWQIAVVSTNHTSRKTCFSSNESGGGGRVARRKTRFTFSLPAGGAPLMGELAAAGGSGDRER